MKQLSGSYSVGMQQKLKQIQAANERAIKPTDRELISMNFEEKQNFFENRTRLLRKMEESTGIPKARLKELQEAGYTLDELQSLPLCQLKTLLSETNRRFDEEDARQERK